VDGSDPWVRSFGVASTDIDHPPRYPREEYIDKILKPETWGGAIELAILANHYRTEIASIDVETGRIDYFTPDADKNSGNRCILLYSGIHYDAVSLAPMQDAPPDFHQTVLAIMSTESAIEPTLIAAGKLASKLREKKAFTNTATFTLKCEVGGCELNSVQPLTSIAQNCKQGLKGEKEARAHAAETGHVNFGEY
jgi:ubiquitin thioesterase OTU1